jgi:hypothetical protein
MIKEIGVLSVGLNLPALGIGILIMTTRVVDSRSHVVNAFEA